MTNTRREKCLNCEKTIRGGRADAKFCSTKCWRISNELPNSCLSCKKDISNTRLHSYCSKSCKTKCQKYSEERNRKVSEGLRGKKKSLISIEKMKLGLKKQWSDLDSMYNSKEYRQKIGWRVGAENVAKRPEVRKILSEQKKGDLNPAKNSDVRVKMSSARRERKLKLGYLNSPSTREKLRIIQAEKNIESGRSYHNIGRNEKELLDQQEQLDECKILRQYHVLGTGSWVDGYCPETNTVYEVYEPFHRNRIEEDLKRQERISKKLNCSFKIIWSIS